MRSGDSLYSPIPTATFTRRHACITRSSSVRREEVELSISESAQVGQWLELPKSKPPNLSASTHRELCHAITWLTVCVIVQYMTIDPTAAAPRSAVVPITFSSIDRLAAWCSQTQRSAGRPGLNILGVSGTLSQVRNGRDAPLHKSGTACLWWNWY